MAERFRVFKVDDMYGVSDDIAQYTVAFDRTKLIMDGLCDLLNALHEENQALKKQLQSEHTMLDNAILLERTRMGQNSLKQYKEAIQ